MLTDQLLAKLRPLVGFRAEPNSPIEWPADLLVNTGLTVDQCHDLLTLQTLRDTYIGTEDSFGDYLENSLTDAIGALIDTLAGKLAEVGLSPRVLLPTPILPLVRLASPINPVAGRRVGFRIRLLSDDITALIEKIGLSVDGVVASVGFHLFREELAPEMPADEVTTVSIAGNRNGHWQLVDFDALEPNVTYLLIYDPAELGFVRALNTFTRWPSRSAGCGSCKGRCWSKYVSVETIQVTGDGEVIPTYGTNYGINLTLSAVGDVSPRLVLDPGRLLPALKQQIAQSFLSKIAYSTRKNPETEDARQGALFALTDKDNMSRVPVLLDRAINSLVKSMQAEASAVLDVDDSDEITWGAM